MILIKFETFATNLGEDSSNIDIKFNFLLMQFVVTLKFNLNYFARIFNDTKFLWSEKNNIQSLVTEPGKHFPKYPVEDVYDP